MSYKLRNRQHKNLSSLSWEGDICLARQEIPAFCRTEGLIIFLQESSPGPCSQKDLTHVSLRCILTLLSHLCAVLLSRVFPSGFRTRIL